MALALADKYELARLVGRINREVVARGAVPTLLLGPGRWGTSTPRLGVPVRFAEISAMTAIAEVAFSAGGLQPELSFGTHFFQDLVETGIFYVALNPEREECFVNSGLLRTLPNRLEETAARRCALRAGGSRVRPAAGLASVGRYRQPAGGVLPRSLMPPDDSDGCAVDCEALT